VGLVKDFFGRCAGGFSRRDIVRRGGLLALPAFLRPAAAQLKVGPNVYESLGVRPLINCRGTLTIIGGSLELPEVRAAKEAAAMHYVQLDELMEAIGKRLAALTGAEWGMVSAGCAAAIAHATAACVAGGNPDRHVRIPNLTGFPKDEVIIPLHSRNVYDAAVRSVGVRVIEVADVAQYQDALGPRVAMVYVFAGPRAENGPLPYEAIYRLARERNVPVMVDAAAEILTIPNVHLQRGATLVGYSGGKCIRGPQCAGLLLGRKDLVRAAWVQSAPHHGYSRGMKVGKEEMIGMLAAVEAWVKRDHKAELATWIGWLNHIAGRVSRIEGIKTGIREPVELSNYSPVLSITWDAAKLGITGAEAAEALYNGEPRIALNGRGGRGRGGAGAQTGISISAHMMEPGEEKIVADRIHALLSRPRAPKPPEAETAPAGDLTGRWDVHIEYAAGSSDHVLHIRQQGNQLVGTHQGDFLARDLNGSISGDAVRISSFIGESHGDSLSYRFSGKLSGDGMSGSLALGEYLDATWTARRHSFGRNV